MCFVCFLTRTFGYTAGLGLAFSGLGLALSLPLALHYLYPWPWLSGLMLNVSLDVAVTIGHTVMCIKYSVTRNYDVGQNCPISE